MDSDFIEVIFVIGAIILVIVFFKYFLIVLGVVAALIAVVATVRYVKKQNSRKQMVLEDVSKGDVDDFIKQSSTKIQNLRRYYYKIKDEDMRESLDDVTAGLKEIIETIKKDSRDYKSVRRFLNISLDSSEKILSQSAQLYSLENPNEKTTQAIEDAKEGLDLISTAVNNQINKLYDNNAMDLDIELKVLKKVLSSKGLLNESNKENEDDQRND